MSVSSELFEPGKKSLPADASPGAGDEFTGVARWLDRIVFGGLLGLIVVTEIPYGTVDPWWVAFFECVVFILSAVWICQGALAGTWRLKKLWIILPLALLTAFAFVQTIEWPFTVRYSPIPQRTLTIDPYQTHLTALKGLALTLFVALLLIHVSTMKRLRWLVRTVIGIGLASAVFGIMRQLLQSPTSWGFGLPYLFPGVGYAQFIGANEFSYLMEMTFALIAGLVLGGGVQRNRIPVYFAAALLVWAALVLSNSRGGILALAGQCILLSFVSLDWYFRRKRARSRLSRNRFVATFERSVLARSLVVILMVGALLGGVLWLGGEQLVSKFNQQALSQNINDTDGTTRRQIWRSTWTLIKENGWNGVGFGAYYLAIPHYMIGSGKIKVEQAHNDYLDLLASGGVVACALAVWFVASIMRRVLPVLRAPNVYRRAACLAALAGIVDVGIHSFVDFGLQLTGIAVVFAALLAIMMAEIRPDGEASVKRPNMNTLRRRRASANAATDSGVAYSMEFVVKSGLTDRERH